MPRLPIIEPERAAAPPLAITLDDFYRYRLEGRETIDGRRCYVVRFEPRATASASLFEGRAWIAADDVRDGRACRRRRPDSTDRSLASEQTDEFARDGKGIWLLARSDVHQTYEGASIRTPIHRLLVLDAHEINAPDFERAATQRTHRPT